MSLKNFSASLIKRSCSTHVDFSKFKFPKCNIYCSEEDCIHHRKRTTVTSDACCVTKSPAIGFSHECYCKKFKGGGFERVADKKIDTTLFEMKGCVFAANFIKNYLMNEDVVLLCDNESCCDYFVGEKVSDRSDFNRLIAELKALKFGDSFSGPWWVAREYTHAADDIARYGLEEHKKMRLMDSFLSDVRKFGRDLEIVQKVSELFPTAESAAPLLSDYGLLLLQYYRRIHLLLQMGPVHHGADSGDKRLLSEDLAFNAMVAAYISTLVSSEDHEIDPHGFQSFDKYLFSCNFISGHGNQSFLEEIEWYYPSKNLLRMARADVKEKAESRRKMFFHACSELDMLMKSLGMMKSELAKPKAVIEEVDSRADASLTWFGKVNCEKLLKFVRNVLSPLAGSKANQKLFEEPGYTKGLIVAFTLKSKFSANDFSKNGTQEHASEVDVSKTDGASVEDLMAVFQKFGTVKYVDFKRGEESGYIRFEEPEASRKACAAAVLNEEGGLHVKKYVVTIEPVSGNAEQEYWSQLHENQKSH